MNKKRIFQLIEKELIVILALVLLLGIVVGYSLAASSVKQSVPTTSIGEQAPPSIMGSGVDEGLR